MKPFTIVLIFSILFLSACQPEPSASSDSETSLNVLAAESFLADIAQNVAGDRLQVQALLPLGLDPHAFEPTPKDVAKIADSDVLIVNGAGLESWMANIQEAAGGERTVIEAAAGITALDEHPSAQAVACGTPDAHDDDEDEHGQDGDPHFWLDPLLVITYVQNIRDGLSLVDPGGQETYRSNAQAYIDQLEELDAWVVEQVSQIPAERRLLVTNHESLGYFADRYGFSLIGAILPSFSTGASPSAAELARLVDCIQASGAPAIFLETGANPQLADQLAQESGITVVTELYSHSLTPPDGDAPDYLSMMKFNTQAIVDALR